MKKPFSVKRTVFIFLILHTTAVIMAAVVMLRREAPFNSLLVKIVFIAFSAAITLYTASEIVRRINEEITNRANSLSQFSSQLKTVSANLDKYARELERRAGMINEYTNKITVLAALMDAAQDDRSTEEQGAVIQESRDPAG